MTSTQEQTKENFEFDVDTNQLMDIIIKSIYSTPEVFLRELISNSSDACDKLKAVWLDFQDKGVSCKSPTAMEIEIISDPVNKTLTIKDNGIGMKKSDLINFVGTVASSGTRKFKELLKNDTGKTTDISNLIGQFGLGFYSSYLVAEKVDIVTKHPEDDAYLWSSDGKSGYTIEKYEGQKEHGTSVILYIKEGCEEFLESKKIDEIIKKHSQFVVYPIFTYEEKEVEDVDAEEAKTEETNTESEEPKVEDENKEKEVKKKKVIERVKMNAERPLWSRELKDIPEAELTEFYKKISGSWDTYLAVDSWTVDTNLLTLKLTLFIPKVNVNGLLNKNKKNNNIKLYANNVFVTDDFGDNIPEWANFVVGVLSSDDIAMNVSREMIQGHSIMRVIKKVFPKKVIEMVSNLSADKEKFDTFYREFGRSMKFGVHEIHDTQQEKLASLLRYPTTKSGDKTKTFDEYIDGMKEDQKQIYVLTGLDKKQVETSPFLELYKELDLEVILMHDAVDEIMLKALKKYKEKPIQQITSEGAELPSSSAENEEEVVKSFEAVSNKLKEVLGGQVEKINVNPRLKGVPGLILTTKYSNSSAMESIMRSQLMIESNPMAAMAFASKKIFEISPAHPICVSLKALHDEGKDEDFVDMSKTFYDTVLINCGFVVEDIRRYCKTVYKLMS